MVLKEFKGVGRRGKVAVVDDGVEGLHQGACSVNDGLFGPGNGRAGTEVAVRPYEPGAVAFLGQDNAGRGSA